MWSNWPDLLIYLVLNGEILVCNEAERLQVGSRDQFLILHVMKNTP